MLGTWGSKDRDLDHRIDGGMVNGTERGIREERDPREGPKERPKPQDLKKFE